MAVTDSEAAELGFITNLLMEKNLFTPKNRKFRNNLLFEDEMVLIFHVSNANQIAFIATPGLE